MFTERSISAGLVGTHSGGQFGEILPFALSAALVLACICLLVGLGRGPTAVPKSRWSLWEKLVYLVTLVSVAILSVTSFGALLWLGELSGWALMAHMTGAGMFVFTLPVLAITWCEPSRFDIGPVGAQDATAPRRFYWLPKLMFWIVLAGGLIVSMTMLLSMLPLFGTEEFGQLLDLHRYSGLVVMVALALHFTGVVLQRLGRR
jgi:hypothetical protein